jgi:spermidine/putrescine transport system permease protein
MIAETMPQQSRRDRSGRHGRGARVLSGADPRSRRGPLLVLPAALWLVVFFVLPLLLVVVISLVERGRAGGVRTPLAPTLEYYGRLFDPLYIGVFWKSARIAFVVTGVCVLLGYPLAVFISRAPVRARSSLMMLVMIPFWTNFLVRTYAMKQLLAAEGGINGLLLGLGLIREPLSLIFNEFAVVLGLVYGYLPFAVLPLYASIEKFDLNLLEAASDLGANLRRAFLRVMLPLTLPGVVAAVVLVFVPVVGAFITPDIMGGGKVEMIGTLINRQFGVARNWPFGSAMSLALMLMVVVGVLYYFRTSDEKARPL